MEGQLSSLSEGLATAWMSAGIRSLTCVSVGVFFEVLCECELLEADQANELFVWVVSDLVSSQGEFGREFFVASIEVAGEVIFAHGKYEFCCCENLFVKCEYNN